MIDLDKLRRSLAAYRKQVQPAWSAATAHPGYAARPGDPAGQCGVTSAWLQKRLKADHGVTTVYYHGNLWSRDRGDLLTKSHCWLMDGPIVIDLTASQYGLGEVVCGHRLDLIPHYQGEPGRRPLKRLRILEEAL